MIRLSLKAKFTIAASVLVLAVVTTVSGLYIARLTRQVLRQADDRARFVAQEIFLACQNALTDAAERGEAPASSSPADMRAYVTRAFDGSSTLNALIESAVGYSPTIYEVTISDRNAIVLVSSDAALRGQKIPARPAVASLVRAGFFQQLRTLYGPPQVYEDGLPFNIGAGPFGDIRVGLSSALIRDEISPSLRSAGWYALASVLLSTFLAAFVSRISLAPIDRISKQLDRIRKGEFDKLDPVERSDEFGAVSTKIADIGKQLRDVREVFSTLRENLDQVMGGLGDGVLLFNAEGRAVLVSPSVEKFLDTDPEQLRGARVSEIFPPGHPIRGVLRIHGDDLQPVEGAEMTLKRASGPDRISLSVQVAREQGVPMGTLVTLRDIGSLARIGSQLQISEGLAKLGRLTAGVAHEVKNPLNSMRLWLEVLKANMPVDPEPHQAVRMLDTEIDRLDRAVKTFLDYTKPVEPRIEETDLLALLQEVRDAAGPAVGKAGLQLRFDLPAQFPSVRLDRQLIHQAVLNLVLNACDFTSRGGHVALRLSHNAEYAVIAVSDSGRGIAPENREKVFQLFFTTRPGGTGIGLANTFRFVELHNGRIEFDSEVGRGTTFRVELPLARAAESAAGKIRGYSQPFAEEKR